SVPDSVSVCTRSRRSTVAELEDLFLLPAAVSVPGERAPRTTAITTAIAITSASVAAIRRRHRPATIARGLLIDGVGSYTPGGNREVSPLSRCYAGARQWPPLIPARICCMVMTP